METERHLFVFRRRDVSFEALLSFPSGRHGLKNKIRERLVWKRGACDVARRFFFYYFFGFDWLICSPWLSCADARVCSLCLQKRVWGDPSLRILISRSSVALARLSVAELFSATPLAFLLALIAPLFFFRRRLRRNCIAGFFWSRMFWDNETAYVLVTTAYGCDEDFRVGFWNLLGFRLYQTVNKNNKKNIVCLTFIKCA